MVIWLYFFVLIGVLYGNNNSKYRRLSVNRNPNKIYKLSILQATFLSLKLIGMVFLASDRTAYIISSHVIIESSAIFSKYLPFSLVHVLGFQL